MGRAVSGSASARASTGIQSGCWPSAIATDCRADFGEPASQERLLVRGSHVDVGSHVPHQPAGHAHQERGQQQHARQRHAALTAPTQGSAPGRTCRVPHRAPPVRAGAPAPGGQTTPGPCPRTAVDAACRRSPMRTARTRSRSASKRHAPAPHQGPSMKSATVSSTGGPGTGPSRPSRRRAVGQNGAGVGPGDCRPPRRRGRPVVPHPHPHHVVCDRLAGGRVRCQPQLLPDRVETQRPNDDGGGGGGECEGLVGRRVEGQQQALRRREGADHHRAGARIDDDQVAAAESAGRVCAARGMPGERHDAVLPAGTAAASGACAARASTCTSDRRSAHAVPAGSGEPRTRRGISAGTAWTSGPSPSRSAPAPALPTRSARTASVPRVALLQVGRLGHGPDHVEHRRQRRGDDRERREGDAGGNQQFEKRDAAARAHRARQTE